MMTALYAGVSGLGIHQTKMDVIGNNIANVNTIAYKSSSVLFSDVFSQTIQSATGAGDNSGGSNPMQIGLGAAISSIDINMSEGSAQTTDSTLDLKIEGDGFFITSDSTGNYFTRAGSFRVDETGYLVNPDGLYVMGWQPDDDGEIVSDTVSEIELLSAENSYIEPEMTESVTIEGNIDMTDDQVTSDDGYPFTSSFYDSMGYKYTASFTVTQVDESNYTITLTDVTDENGISFTDDDYVDAGYTFTEASTTVTFDADGYVTTDPAEFDLADAGISTPFSTIMGDGIDGGDEFIADFSDLTLFSGSTTIAGYAGDSDGSGAGNASGTIAGYEVGTDGIIVGRYTNGQTKTLAQIVVTDFANPEGLQKVGDSLYIETSNSGEFDGIGQDITSYGGSINSGALEMSNVDLASEFTDMITTQRGFQANSRIITTCDEMLQELVNLK